MKLQRLVCFAKKRGKKMKKLKKERDLIKLNIDDLKDVNGGTIFGAEDSYGLIYFVRGILETRDFLKASNFEKKFIKNRHIELSLCDSIEEAERVK